MSTSIDERVVAMSFENAKFEAGVAQTMKTLSKLDATLGKVGGNSGFAKIEAEASKVTLRGPMSALDKLKSRLGFIGSTKGFTDVEKEASKVTLSGPMSALDKLRSRLGFIGDTKGFTDIERASDQVTLSGLDKAVEGVKVKFGALQAVALGALTQIGAKATQTGGSFLKDLTVGPITQGLEEYGTTLTSVQTILANTQDSGGNLKSVNAALLDLNHYSDKTIYNFSQMAKNIGTFTAAGVDLKTATGSIKGIANLAALSGSTSEQASTAMYQLSQAIAAGRVSLQDWNSVVNAGMGGAVFQKALARSAVAMGTLNENAVKVDKTTGKLTINGESFRESITAKPGQKSWLSSEVLTGSLKQFTGDMTDAELAAQGFSKEQIAAIQKQAKMAQHAATESKTLKQVFDVTKEAIGSGWAQTWQTIFGDFGEAKTLFTGMATSISNIIGRSASARNKILGDWKKLGGRNLLIESLKTGLHALGDILGTVKKAFRDVFPAQTGKGLFELTKRFASFTKSLQSSPETLDNLRRTFRGLFAVLDIGWYIVKKVAGVILDLLGVAKDGSGGFLAFTGGIGDFLTGMDKAISKGDALGGFFEGLTAILRVPLEILKSLGSVLGGLFDGMDGSKADAAAKSVDGVSRSLSPLKNILDHVVDAWKNFVGFIQNIKVPPFITHLVDNLKGLGSSLGNSIKNTDFSAVFAAIQTTLIGGIFLTIRKAIGKGFDPTRGVLSNVNKVLGGLTGNLKAMQGSIHAATILEIATALGILAAGVKVLSTIDPAALTSAMTAVAIGLGQLVAAMVILSKATSGGAFLSMPLVAAAMIGLATAVTILAGAVKIFSTLSWDELGRGLTGVGGALTAIGIGLKFISGPSLLVVGPGLIAVALAMNVLGVAMKIFSGFSWDEIVKGIIGLGGSLIVLGLGLSAIGPETIIVGPGLIAVALGLTLLSGAVHSFGGMKLEDLAKGIGGIGAALVVIGLAISAIPPTIALQAAGLVILAVALTGIAGAVKLMGGMDLATLGKGLLGLGAALVILSVGLAGMTTALPGAAALLVTAAALAILVPTLGIMGNLKWGTIFKGLGAIALVLGTLALVGVVASSGLLALGVALTTLGVAAILAGTGFLLVAKGFQLIGETGTKGVAVMIAAMTAFLIALPKLVIDFVKGLVEIIGQVAELAPQIVDSLVKIVKSLLQVVIDAAPKLAEAAGALIMAFVKVIDENTGPLIAAGAKLILQLLTGISSNIGQVTAKLAEIITKFLATLTAHIPALINAGARFIVAFLTGVGNHIASVIAIGGRVIAKFLEGIARAIPGIVGGVAHIIVAFLRAVGDAIPRIVRAGIHLAKKFINAVAHAMVALADVGAHAIIRFMNELAKVIEENADEFVKAGFRIAAAVVKGFGKGMLEARHAASDALNEAVFNNEGPGSKQYKNDLKSARAAKARGVKRSQLEGVYEDDILDAVYGKKRKRRRKSAPKQVKAPTGYGGRTKMTAPFDDVEPTITPVVDLTNVEQGAKKIDGLLAVSPARSLDQASAISSTAAAAQADAAGEPPVKEIKFEQNNYSPESLTPIEIYRRTNNQLGQAKTALLGAA